MAASRKMFRLTVAAPYYTRQRGKKKNKGSPFSSAFIKRGWFALRKQAERAVSRFIDEAIEGRDSAVTADRESFSKDDQPNIEIKSVNYDARFLDIEEEQNERIQY